MNREIITPEVAKALLNKNTNNRNITQSHLALIKSEILSGKWQYNGQPIIVGNTGRLLDGQHRLTAVVETGIPIDTAIIKGIDEDAFVTIDTGKVRGGADVLSIAGSKHGSHVASAIRKILEQFGGTKKCQGKYSHKISNGEYLAVYQEHGEELTDLFDLVHSWVLNGSRLLSESDAAGHANRHFPENRHVLTRLRWCNKHTGRFFRYGRPSRQDQSFYCTPASRGTSCRQHEPKQNPHPIS